MRNTARAYAYTRYPHSIWNTNIYTNLCIHLESKYTSSEMSTYAMNSMSHIYIINNIALPLTSCGLPLPLCLALYPYFAATLKYANE